MYKHFIVVTSAYSLGQRVAWHYSSKNFEIEVIQRFLEKIKKKHGDIQLGYHRMSTVDGEWSSIVKSDKYFEDIIATESVDKFIEMVNYDQDLNALDIAKYVLSIQPMSHLKLQKITYLIYEKYLVSTGVPLFKDEIFAWKHGPVILNVYEEYKKYKSTPISNEEDDSEPIHISELKIPPSFMRIITSLHGEVVLRIAHEVLKDYSNYTAWQLVEITHREGTPWKKVYKEGRSKRITEDLILSLTPTYS